MSPTTTRADHRISFADGELSYDCARDDTILRAALRAGLSPGYECNSGGCGSCRFELVDGTVHDRRPDAPGLTARDRRKGRKLACQSEPRSNCVIRIGVGGGLRAHRPIRQAATLKEVQPLTADMAEFTFQTANPAAFTPGQYAMIHLPDGEVERAYSMSNVSNCHGHWRFVIKRTPNGHASSLLFDKLEPGATVTLDGPFGNAYLRPDDGRDIVCVGGGSGLGAMVSVVLGAAAQPGAENRTVHLFIGARNAADLVVPAPVEMAARRLNSLQIHTALSEEVVQGGGSAGNALVEGAYPGFVHEAVVTDLGESLESFTFYAAGPSAMTEQLARSLVVERGVDADRLHFDRFC